MARGARIGDLVFIRHGPGDEIERVRVHPHIGDRGLDGGHVAGNAITPWGVRFVVGVFFERRRVGAIEPARRVAIQADHIRRFAQFGVISRAVRVVAARTGYAAPVHYALHEIVALHADSAAVTSKILSLRWVKNRGPNTSRAFHALYVRVRLLTG